MPLPERRAALALAAAVSRRSPRGAHRRHARGRAAVHVPARRFATSTRADRPRSETPASWLRKLTSGFSRGRRESRVRLDFLEIAGQTTFLPRDAEPQHPVEKWGHPQFDLTLPSAPRHSAAPLPAEVRELIEHELELIAELRYEPTSSRARHRRVARSQDILCQGPARRQLGGLLRARITGGRSVAHVDAVERFISASATNRRTSTSTSEHQPARR